MKRDRDSDRDENKQEVVEQVHGEAERGGKDGVKRQRGEFLVEGENGEEDDPAEEEDQPQTLSRNGQHIPKEEVAQVHGVTADGGDERDAEREHARENNSDGGIFFDLGIFADRADAQRRDNGCAKRPPEQRFARAAADEIPERDAGQNRVRERVAEECHAAQDNERADYCTDDAN